MQKKDITILIVEDDASLGKALKECIEREGYSTLLFHHPDQIYATLKLRPIHAFIIDCMLPKTSGVEVAKRIKEQVPNPVFIFMSGIYQDKSFIKDTLQKTGAVAFLEKPFALEKLVEVLQENLSQHIEEDAAPLIEILYNPTATPLEKVSAIKKTSAAHGFLLPKIISLLISPTIKGVLTLKLSNKQHAAIYFLSGSIVRVDVHDPKSFFGALLIDKNYCAPEDLELVLTQKSTKRLGERLVDSNLISPHVIDVINTEQLALRLSSLIQNTNYEINFEESATSETGIRIERDVLTRFMSEWLVSKYTTEWLKNYYLPLIDKRIIKGAHYADLSQIYALYPLNKAVRFAQFALNGFSIEQILSKKQWADEIVFKSIHLLLLAEFISFDRLTNPQDEKSHLMRLQTIKKDMESQNLFEILGLSNNAKYKEIKKSYYDLSKIFHPDKVNSNATQQIKDLTGFIFAKISKAYETLSNETSKSNYLKELEHGEAEKILESESLFEEGKSLLSSNHASKALALFDKALKLRPPTSEIRLYYLWAKILSPPQGDIKEYLLSIESDLNKIPPEDRHNATYYFVKGLYFKQIGDFDQASRALKHANSLVPNFKEAKRELNVVELHQKNNSKPVDLLKVDLKDVVGLLFKKKR